MENCFAFFVLSTQTLNWLSYEYVPSNVELLSRFWIKDKGSRLNESLTFLRHFFRQVCVALKDDKDALIECAGNVQCFYLFICLFIYGFRTFGHSNCGPIQFSKLSASDGNTVVTFVQSYFRHYFETSPRISRLQRRRTNIFPVNSHGTSQGTKTQLFENIIEHFQRVVNFHWTV